MHYISNFIENLPRQTKLFTLLHLEANTPGYTITYQNKKSQLTITLSIVFYR